MFLTRLRLVAASVAFISLGVQPSLARDLRITIPKHTEATPVQRLNREGVDAVRRQQYEKAEALFLKAYLFDPADPFTLNNLGYIAELQGQLDRALNFYKLASQQGSEASIARSNAKQLEGKPMGDALSSLKDVPMRVNRMNVMAISLLSENRNEEAAQLLQQALGLDPQNTFTLNNLGVAQESIGNYAGALKYYSAAAASHSKEPIVVTLNRSWRGRPVSEMAAESAQKLEKRMQETDNDQARAALLTVRAVSATNRNDWQAAKTDFLKAYALDPNSAFSLNNLGYVSERDGDLETAAFYYAKALKAQDANARIGLATQSAAEGKHVDVVATDSDQKVDGELDQFRQQRQQQAPAAGDIELQRRDGSTPPPASTPAPASEQTTPQASTPQPTGQQPTGPLPTAPEASTPQASAPAVAPAPSTSTSPQTAPQSN